MKKTVALILGMTLVCCGFTACGNDKNSSSEAEKTTESVTENKDRTNGTDYSNNKNGIEEIVTGAENVVDDLVSEGERIVDNAGSALDSSRNGNRNND